MDVHEASHVVLLPLPAQGHIAPIIHLSKRLASQGFIVTIVNIDSVHEKLLEKWICPPGLDIRLEQVSCKFKSSSGFDAEFLRKENEDPGSALAAVADIESEVEDLLLKKLQPPPCSLVADFFYPWAARLAKALDIIPVTYWPGSAAWSALHQYIDLLISNGDAFLPLAEVEDERRKKQLIDYIPGVAEFEHDDFPDYIKIHLSETKRNFFVSSKDRMRDSEWTLVNSMVELEPQTFRVMQADLPGRQFVSVGPLFPLDCQNVPLGVSLRDEEGKCLEWLGTCPKHSVLYISFGSITGLPKTTFEEVAAGIEASQQSFLWVIRPDLIEGMDEGKFDEFLERTRQQGLVVSWAPQVEVLGQSSVGGFFSHCGWNSTFESLCNGVPLLCWPFIADQQLNCKMVVEDWGLGKRFCRGTEVGRVEVEEKIRGFMHGPETEEIRFKLQAFKESARRTVGEGGASNTNLEAFMHALHEKRS